MRARPLVEAVALALAAWLSLASSNDESTSNSSNPTPVYDTWVAPGPTCHVNTDCVGFQLTDRCAAQVECVTGYCIGKPAVDCSATPGSGVCLAATCLPTTGECRLSATADGSYCQPTDLCQAAGTCTAGVCKSTTQVCEDNNPCTTNACSPTLGCQFAPLTEGSPCNDGSACTANDACTSGYCYPGLALDCNDNNPCTSDGCDAAAGCVHSTFPDGYYCDDTNPCTDAGTCSAGQCQLTNSAAGSPCDDAEPCTMGTTCLAGACQGGAPTVCPNDGFSACYESLCQLGVGCQTSMKAVGAPCNATATDPCATTGACAADGNCYATGHKENGSPCSDSNCVDRQCQSGACQIMQYKPDGTLCLLNSLCIYDGTCVGGNGQCQYTGPTATPVNCDDGDPCTVDTCDPQYGCTHTPTNGCVG